MDFYSYASGSDGNCYRLSDGATDILIECGISIKRIMTAINHRVSRISGVLVSHCHKDHSLSAKDLARRGLDIYTSRGTLDACKLAGHRYHEVRAREVFTIGTLTIYPFETKHDCPEPLGFYIISRETNERLLFFTDTFYVKERFAKIDYICGECNYSLETLSEEIDSSRRSRLYESHMSLEHFAEFLEANDLSQLKTVWLLHLSDENSDAALFKRTVQHITGVPVYVC